MTFGEAARVLGVKLDGLREEALNDAYKAAVKAAHPDAGGQSRYSIEHIKKARETLRVLTDGQAVIDNQCPTCQGSGTTPGVIGRVKCYRCKGSGKL